MRWFRQGKKRWLVGLGALALLFGLFVLATLRQPAVASSSLVEARARWEARLLPNYSLTITQETVRGLCEQEMTISDDRAMPLHNDCGTPATWTVSRLFDWIAELEREQTRCYPDVKMCACRGVTSTIVRYDETLGYPREVIYAWHKRPNLLNSDYYRSLFDRSFPGCDKDGRGGSVIYTVTLTEEPS